jgi:DNA-binding XRE family transcriptional regulator
VGRQVTGRENALPSNKVQTFREGLMMSKAELARKAGLSTLTIDRVEAGRPCRLDTKRKILLALGLKVSDKDRIFSGRPDVSRVAVSPADAELHTAHASADSTPIRESMSAVLREEEEKGEAIR